MPTTVKPYVHTDQASVEGAQSSRQIVTPYRLRGLLVAGVCWLGLGVAAWLSPAVSGQGTHEQLGIPPCSMLVQTGWPCPTCGLTTSMAAMTHGKIALAWRAHPFGVVVFLLVVVLAVTGTAELATGRNVIGKLRPSVWWLWALLIAMLSGWLVKLTAGYLRGDYPLR